MEYTFTTNFRIWGQGPRAPTLPPSQSLTIGQLSNMVHALMEYTFTTNFHIWGQGPPGSPDPGSPPHNVLRLGS